MEEEELLFLGSGMAVVTSRGTQGCGAQKRFVMELHRLLGYESAPSFTIGFLHLSPAFSSSPIFPVSVPSQCAGGPVALLPLSTLPRPSAPLPWGRKSLTLSAQSQGHLETSTRRRSSVEDTGSQREGGDH